MLERRIQDLLGSQELVYASPDSSITQAAKIMAEAHVGAVLVGSVDEVSGIISERDILERVIVPGLSADKTTLSEVLTSEPVFVTPAETMHIAITNMKEHRSRYVLVKSGIQVVGIISVVDVLRAVVDAGVEDAHKYDHLWEGIPI